MTVSIDLHSHSTASDGTLSPSELVRKAVQNGVQVLALTDHDETAGLELASNEAAKHDLQFVPGIELSVSWSHQTVHIIGLQIESNTPELQSGIKRLREFRNWRGEEIARRLEKKGIGQALEGAKHYSKGSILSRTHFAHFLVEHGYAKDVRQVFKKFLVKGKPGYVPGEWSSLEEAVSWIEAAGGMAVIAHPARYRFSATRLKKLLAEFKELGGLGIEVISGSQSRDEIGLMAQLAIHYELVASQGSDYHGPENAYIDLGRLPTMPESCLPIWQHARWRSIRNRTKQAME